MACKTHHYGCECREAYVTNLQKAYSDLVALCKRQQEVINKARGDGLSPPIRAVDVGFQPHGESDCLDCWGLEKD